MPNTLTRGRGGKGSSLPLSCVSAVIKIPVVFFLSKSKILLILLAFCNIFNSRDHLANKVTGQGTLKGAVGRREGQMKIRKGTWE